MAKTRTIHVALLEEGSWAARPTEVIELGNGLFEVLPTPDYDPEDEVWEFVPGSTVRIEQREDELGSYWLAVKP